jgi:hypothetical protein
MPSFGRLPDAAQERLNVVLARLDEQVPVGILAHVLSEESKPFPTWVMTVFAGDPALAPAETARRGA